MKIIIQKKDEWEFKMKIRILRLIKRDLKVGFINNRYKFLGIILIFSLITLFNIVNIKNEVLELGFSSKCINFIDIFFITFRGGEYDASYLPITWILINIYITYLIGSYCYDDLSKDSAHLIVRMNNRKEIWISKIIWMIMNVIFFYVIINIVIALFSITMLGFDFAWSEFSRSTMLNSIQNKYSSTEFVLFTLSMYILSSVTLAALQMVISLVIKPIYIYIVNISLISIALCVEKFIIPIQSSMILRQNIFDNTYPINPVNSVIYNLTVLIIVIIMGSKVINNIDILSSQKTD